MGRTSPAIYDFALLPYALGDVLTWNIHSAMRCEELGRDRADVYLCLAEGHAAQIFQRDFVAPENNALFLAELFGAFGTHPRLGDIFLYRSRKPMLEALRARAGADSGVAPLVAAYEKAIASGDQSYFRDNAYSHEGINAFYSRHGRIPLLQPSLGCGPDVEALLGTRFAGRRIVPFHMRLRRLDAALAGEGSHHRDSDFVEWFEFLQEAARRHPEVQIVALGRVQEKPLELLELPNVVSLRSWGLGLGHELSLLLRSDLFLGTSSGFAAMAYFSAIPYFITRMTEGACKGYAVEFGAKRFPFGHERQELVYEPETRELLLGLLERGLAGAAPRNAGAPRSLDPALDVRSWEWERSRWLYPRATTYRFFNDATYRRKETAFLLWPRVKEARAAWRRGNAEHAWAILERLERGFPQVCARFPEFQELRLALALERDDRAAAGHARAALTRLAANGAPRRSVMRYLARAYPAALRAKVLWNLKHHVPRKLSAIAKRLALRR